MEHVNGFQCGVSQLAERDAIAADFRGSRRSQASAQAHGIIYNMVQRQAVMLAFVDNFKMLGVVFLAVIPVLVLMKKAEMAAGSVPVH